MSNSRALEDLTAAELVERVKAAEAALQDFADHGTRHDTTPTVANPDVPWWYGYVESMDRGVRERARRALSGPEPAPESPQSHSGVSVDPPDPESATEPILRPTDQRASGGIIPSGTILGDREGVELVIPLGQRYEPPTADDRGGCCR